MKRPPPNCPELFSKLFVFQSTTARSKVQYILKARVNIHARWLEIILMAPPKSANVKALSANESPIIAQNTCFVNKTRNAQKWKHYDGHMSNVAVTRRKQYRLAARRRSPDLRGVFLVLIVWQPAFSPHNSPLIHGCTHNQAADEIFTRAPSEENFFLLWMTLPIAGFVNSMWAMKITEFKMAALTQFSGIFLLRPHRVSLLGTVFRLRRR